MKEVLEDIGKVILVMLFFGYSPIFILGVLSYSLDGKLVNLIFFGWLAILCLVMSLISLFSPSELEPEVKRRIIQTVPERYHNAGVADLVASSCIERAERAQKELLLPAEIWLFLGIILMAVIILTLSPGLLKIFSLVSGNSVNYLIILICVYGLLLMIIIGGILAVIEEFWQF